MLNPKLELLHCTVQSILYQKLPKPNWLVLGDGSYWLYTLLDPRGAPDLVCSRQLVSDHEMGRRRSKKKNHPYLGWKSLILIVSPVQPKEALSHEM